MEQFDAWGTRHVGLFTFAQSAKHVGLYQNFYARFLTAIMSSPVAPRQSTAGWSRFGELNVAQQNEALLSCQDIADTLCPGLDLTEEILATHAQGLGDTVLLEGPSGIGAFAVCHYGPRSEAGAGACFIKFAAVRAGASAEQDYLRLLDACETLALAVRMPSRWPGRIWRVTKPIDILLLADSAQKSKAWPCTGITIPVIAAPASTSSTTGGRISVGDVAFVATGHFCWPASDVTFEVAALMPSCDGLTRGRGDTRS